MSLLTRLALPKADIPFDKDDVNCYLPWVIAVMTAITCFVMSVGITLSEVVLDDTANLKNHLQAQIPYADGEETYQAEKVARSLRATEGVAKVELLSASEKAALLENWVGENIDPSDLPLPAIIDIWLEDAAVNEDSVNAQTLQKKLEESVPGIVVEDYANWVGNFNQLTGFVQQVIYVLGFGLLIAAVVIVLLITHASVLLHFRVVKLLHNIGAKDSYITRQFQINATRLTIKGVIPGVIVAALLYVGLSGLLGHFNVLALADIQVGSMHIMLFIALPILMLLTVFFAIEWMVNHLLRRLH